MYTGITSKVQFSSGECRKMNRNIINIQGKKYIMLEMGIKKEMTSSNDGIDNCFKKEDYCLLSTVALYFTVGKHEVVA